MHHLRHKLLALLCIIHIRQAGQQRLKLSLLRIVTLSLANSRYRHCPSFKVCSNCMLCCRDCLHVASASMLLVSYLCVGVVHVKCECAFCYLGVLVMVGYLNVMKKCKYCACCVCPTTEMKCGDQKYDWLQPGNETHICMIKSRDDFQSSANSLICPN